VPLGGLPRPCEPRLINPRTALPARSSISDSESVFFALGSRGITAPIVTWLTASGVFVA
jgi:hypothetical protein